MLLTHSLVGMDNMPQDTLLPGPRPGCFITDIIPSHSSENIRTSLITLITWRKTPIKFCDASSVELAVFQRAFLEELLGLQDPIRVEKQPVVIRCCMALIMATH